MSQNRIIYRIFKEKNGIGFEHIFIITIIIIIIIIIFIIIIDIISIVMSNL